MPSLQSALAVQDEPVRGRTAPQSEAYETDGNAALSPSGAQIGHDLSRFDQREAVREARAREASAVPVTRRKAKTKPKLSVVSLVLSVFVAVASAALIATYVNVTITSDQLARLKVELSALQNTGVLLNTQYESRYDLSEVEELAQAKLGMVKMDRSQKEYVEIHSPDTIKRVAPSEASRLSTFIGGLVKSFNSALDFLGG